MSTSEHPVSAKDPSEREAQESLTSPRTLEMTYPQESRIATEPLLYQQSASSRLGLNQKNIAKAPDPVSYTTDTFISKSTAEHPVSAIVTSEHEAQSVTSPRTPEMTNLQASRIATEPLSYQQTASSRLGLNQENVANSPDPVPQTTDTFLSKSTSEHTVTAKDISEHETRESATSARTPEMMNLPESRITTEPSFHQQTASFRLGLDQENAANSPDPVPQTTDTFRSKSTSEHTITAKDTSQHETRESVTSPRTSEMMNPQENRITTEPSSYQQTASSSFGLPVNLIFVPHTTDTFHSKNTCEHPVLESVTRTPAVTTLQASRIATEQQAAHYRLGLQQKNVAKKPDPPPPTYLHETFRKQMVLLQRKGNSEVVDLTGDEAVVKKNKSNLPHLLKISCNCNWTPIRSQLLNIISELADEGYPEVQSFKISTFNVAILPWEEEPHEVPKHLHGTLPMFMHSINIQVHLEKKRSAAAQYKVSAEPVNPQPTPTLPPIGSSGLQGLRYTVPAEPVNQLHAQTSPPVGISGLQGLQISGKIDNLRSTYVFTRKNETSDQDLSKCGIRSIDNNDNSSAKDTDKQKPPSLVEDTELKIASCTSLKDASDLQRAFSPFEQSSNSETVVQDSESIIEKQSTSIPRQDPVDPSSVGLGTPELGVSCISSVVSPQSAHHVGESSVKQEPISGLGTSTPDSKTTSPNTEPRTLADDQITQDALSSSHRDKPDAAPNQEIKSKTRDISPSPSAQTLDESSALCSTGLSGTPVSAAYSPSSNSVKTTDQALDSSIAHIDQKHSPSDQTSSSSVSHSDEAVSGTTKALSVPDQPSSSSMSHSEQELSDKPKSASGKSSCESIPSTGQDENVDESESISHEENCPTAATVSDSSPSDPVQTTSPICPDTVNSDLLSQDGMKSDESAEVVSELNDNSGRGNNSSSEKNGKESAETEIGQADSGSLETISKPNLENCTQQDGPSESQESVHLSEDGVRSSSVDEDCKKVPQSCMDSATTTVSSDTRAVSTSSQPQQGAATSESIIGQCEIRDTIPQACEQMGLTQSKGQLKEPNCGSGVHMEKTTSKSPLMVDNVSTVGITAVSTDPASIPSAAVSEAVVFTTSKAEPHGDGSSSPDSMVTSENDKLVGSMSVSPSDTQSGAQAGTSVSWSTSSKPISAPSVHAPTPPSKQAADLVMRKAGDGEFKPCQRKLQIGPDTQIVKDPVSPTITPHVDSEAVTTLTSSTRQDGTVTSKTSLQQVSTSVSPSTSSTPLPAGIVRRNSLTTQSVNTVHETATRKPVEMKPNVVLNAPVVRGPLRPLRAPVPSTPIIGHMLHNGVRIPIQLFPVACADGQVGMTFSPPAGIGMQGAPLRPAIVQVLPPQPGTPACVVPAQPLSTNKTSPKDKLNAVPITTFPSSTTTSPSATVSESAVSVQSAGKNINLHPIIMPIQPGTTTPGVNLSPTSATVTTPIVSLQGNAQSAGKNKNLHPFIMPLQPGTTTPGVNLSPTSATVSTPIVSLQGNAQSATKNKNTVPLILPFPQGTTTTGVNLPSVAGTISIPYSALKGNTVISGTTTSGVNLAPTSATVSTPIVSLQSAAGKNKNTVPLILPLPSVSGTVSIPYSALKGNTVISPKAAIQSGPQAVAAPGMINLVIDMKDKVATGNKDLNTKQRPSVSTVTASLNAPKLVPVSSLNSSIPSSIGDSNSSPTTLSTTVAASDTKTIEKPSVSKATTFDQKGISDRSIGSGPATMQRLSIQGSTVQRLSIQGDSICRTMSHLSPIQGQFRPLGVSPQTAGLSEPGTVAPPSDNIKAAGETSDRISVTLPLRRGSVDKCLLSSSSTRTGAASPNTARASSPSCVSGVLDQLKSLNDKAVRRRSFSPTSLPFTVVTPGGEEMKQSKISRKSTSPSSVSKEHGGNDAVESLESVSSSGHRVGLSAFTPISSDPAGPSTLEKSSSKSSESHQDVDIKGLATNIYRAAKTASKILQEAGKGPGSSAPFGNSLRRSSLDSSGELVQKEGPPAKKAKMDENVSYSIQNKSSWDDECPDIAEPDTKRLKLDKAVTNAEESGTPDFLARNELDHTLPKIISVQSLAGQVISNAELGSDLAGALKPEGIQRLTGRRKSKLEVRPDGMMPQQRSWPGSPLSSRSGTPTHDALSGSAQFSSYSDDWDDEDEESIIDVGEDMENVSGNYSLFLLCILRVRKPLL